MVYSQSNNIQKMTSEDIKQAVRGKYNQVASDPGTAGVARRMMREARAVAEALGVRFSVGMEKRIAGAAAVGPHRTSMLQDLEKGRPMEIDALVTAVTEMAELVGEEVPTIDTVRLSSGSVPKRERPRAA